MGYAENNLMEDEKILFKAKVHWIIYFPGLVSFMIFIILLIQWDYPEDISVLTDLLSILAVFLLIKAFIFSKTTELVITSKRVIAKFGLIKRSTVELNHNQVESLNVNQGIIERLVGAGSLTITGTGGTNTPIPSVDKPLEFRKQYFKTTEDIKQNNKD